MNSFLAPIILASTSPYRRELLARLNLNFSQQPPICDEDLYKTQIQDPKQLAQFLSKKKTESIANLHPHNDLCIIGGDQLISFQGKVIGKPNNFEKACEQLNCLQGQTHELITAICVIYKNQSYEFMDITKMTMRKLSPEQIERYVKLDQSINCAGSYKIEKHGVSLFSKIESSDFSAIQGIPLIALSELLIQFGYTIP